MAAPHTRGNPARSAAAGLLLSAAALLQGCAAEGDRFRPEQLARGEAVIYVYRPGAAGAPSIAVFVDQQEVGSIGPREYLAAAVAPGEHLVRVRGKRDATRLIMLAGGESAFLEVNAPLFGGRIALARLSNDVARERIAPAHQVPISLQPETQSETEPATEPPPKE